MSYVNKKYDGHALKDTTFEDEDWAELVSPSERRAKALDPSKDPKDHRNLTHRDAPNQHPIEAIEGLSNELNKLVEGLASKVSNDSISAERTSEGLLITIGDHTIIIYDNPDTDAIQAITVNDILIPVDEFGTARISTDGMNISGGLVRVETSEYDSLVPISTIITRLLEAMAEVPQIIFRTWPGLQEG